MSIINIPEFLLPELLQVDPFPPIFLTLLGVSLARTVVSCPMTTSTGSVLTDMEYLDSLSIYKSIGWEWSADVHPKLSFAIGNPIQQCSQFTVSIPFLVDTVGDAAVDLAEVGEEVVQQLVGSLQVQPAHGDQHILPVVGPTELGSQPGSYL